MTTHFERVKKNIVEKGKAASNQHFLLCSQWFQKPYPSESLSQDCVSRVTHKTSRGDFFFNLPVANCFKRSGGEVMGVIRLS